jgi:two-component system nitrate/nitrite response regulator NarL
MTHTLAAPEDLARFDQAVRDAYDGRRPPLSGPELAEFARLIRPGLDATIEVTNGMQGPVVTVRAVRRPPAGKLLEQLSARQREVTRLVARGFSNAEIARELAISVATVKDHVHHILQRLSLRSRQQLVAAVVRDVER